MVRNSEDCPSIPPDLFSLGLSASPMLASLLWERLWRACALRPIESPYREGKGFMGDRRDLRPYGL